MEIIELKPKLFHSAIRVFLLVFISFSIMKYSLFGWYSHPDVLLFLRARVVEGAAATATFLLVLAIPFFRGRFNIRLTETTLQAPVRKWESITVNISDISVNRSFRDRLIGTQIVTKDGQPMHIHTFIYPSKAISNLLDEIERRQEIATQPENTE